MYIYIIVTFNKTLFDTKHIQINIYINLKLTVPKKYNMLLHCLVEKKPLKYYTYIYIYT